MLIIDDEEIVKRSLEKAFLLAGHKVKGTCSGHEGLSIWQNEKFDVVILDVLIPDLAGPEILKTMGQHDSYVVLISAFKGQYDAESAKSLGAQDFIDKPFASIIEFVKRVEKGYAARK